ncbi:response regulator [Paenibacillus sp. FJAT-26967]|uniref:response regulator n=1 Tax=Paenibacillus sp. FJAT-26967 TaxID=1729690 RepID=UPI00083834A7|nr:response regulator [Paenibacillus sp. FJAT-26967]
MIRVMLVDDEEMTRSGLREFVPWEDFNMTVVGEAEDGVQALERFDELEPDLLMCDVRMPRIDGLELARQLKDKAPVCKIIFLSGYSDVDYLKTAIKLQAVDYLEKPVQLDELEKLLGTVAAEIRANREESARITGLKESWNQSMPELTERLLRNLLALRSTGESEWLQVKREIGMVDDTFPTEGNWVCCTAAFGNPAARETWREDAYAGARELGLPILAGIVDGVGVACLALESERHLEPVSLWLNKMTVKGREEGKNRRALSSGNIFHPLYRMAVSYEESMKALHYYFYRGWNSIIWYRELPQQHRSGLQLFEKDCFLKFEDALRRQDFEEAEQLLDQAVNELLLYPSPEIESVRKKLFRWYVAMTQIYPDAMWDFENDELWSSVFVSGELFTIRSFMLRRLEIIKENTDDSASSEKSVIRDVIRYVQHNYNEDVSIAAIANHVYLAPTYLCLLFKKERGISMNEYITQFRIKKAKQLLRDRKLKLYEIAQMVGYQDANYFAKVFRKIAGCNPSEYRDSMEEGAG